MIPFQSVPCPASILPLSPEKIYIHARNYNSRLKYTCLAMILFLEIILHPEEIYYVYSFSNVHKYFFRGGGIRAFYSDVFYIYIVLIRYCNLRRLGGAEGIGFSDLWINTRVTLPSTKKVEIRQMVKSKCV